MKIVRVIVDRNVCMLKIDTEKYGKKYWRCNEGSVKRVDSVRSIGSFLRGVVYGIRDIPCERYLGQFVCKQRGLLRADDNNTNAGL